MDLWHNIHKAFPDSLTIHATHCQIYFPGPRTRRPFDLWFTCVLHPQYSSVRNPRTICTIRHNFISVREVMPVTIFSKFDEVSHLRASNSNAKLTISLSSNLSIKSCLSLYNKLLTKFQLRNKVVTPAITFPILRLRGIPF